ncbi:MAG: hypothetical protein ACRCT8_02615 [Lacipirellulaceae bacterium]
MERLVKLAERKHGSWEAFLREYKAMAKETLQAARARGYCRPCSARQLEHHFGQHTGYLVVDDGVRDERLTQFERDARDEVVRRILSSEVSLYVEGSDNAGREPGDRVAPRHTDLRDVLREIVSGPKFAGCSQKESVIQSACAKLQRDGFAIRCEKTGAYFLKTLTKSELQQVIRIRVQLEVTQVVQLCGVKKRRAQYAFLLQEQIKVARRSVAHTLDFRDADAALHESCTTIPELRTLLRQAIELCDQPLMRMRQLLAMVLGRESEEYAVQLQQFNNQQLTDLVALHEEVASKTCRRTRIAPILLTHAERQLEALDRCEQLELLLSGDGSA